MTANNFGAKGSNRTKLFHVTCRAADMRIWVRLFGGTAPLKFVRAKNVQNSPRFRTTLDFDHKYLRNGSGYRHAENGVINYNPSYADEKMMNFGRLTTYFICLMCTHPKSILQ